MTDFNPYGERLRIPEAERLTRFSVRCANPGCSKLLAEMVTAPWRIKCQRCKSVNQSGPYEPGQLLE